MSLVVFHVSAAPLVQAETVDIDKVKGQERSPDCCASDASLCITPDNDAEVCLNKIYKLIGQTNARAALPKAERSLKIILIFSLRNWFTAIYWSASPVRLACWAVYLTLSPKQLSLHSPTYAKT